jgi:hypothetical protein
MEPTADFTTDFTSALSGVRSRLEGLSSALEEQVGPGSGLPVRQALRSLELLSASGPVKDLSSLAAFNDFSAAHQALTRSLDALSGEDGVAFGIDVTELRRAAGASGPAALEPVLTQALWRTTKASVSAVTRPGEPRPVLPADLGTPALEMTSELVKASTAGPHALVVRDVTRLERNAHLAGVLKIGTCARGDLLLAPLVALGLLRTLTGESVLVGPRTPSLERRLEALTALVSTSDGASLADLFEATSEL